MKASTNALRSAAPAALDSYSLEIARGGSYLASTITAQSRDATLTETVQNFVYLHGKAHLPAFLSAVEDWLLHRNYEKLAEVVAYYREHGKTPEVLEPSKPIRVPRALKPQKLQKVAVTKQTVRRPNSLKDVNHQSVVEDRAA
jgi:hypothetical protein